MAVFLHLPSLHSSQGLGSGFKPLESVNKIKLDLINRRKKKTAKFKKLNSKTKNVITKLKKCTTTLESFKSN